LPFKIFIIEFAPKKSSMTEVLVSPANPFGFGIVIARRNKGIPNAHHPTTHFPPLLACGHAFEPLARGPQAFQVAWS
jgi:hypothetical protein